MLDQWSIQTVTPVLSTGIGNTCIYGSVNVHHAIFIFIAAMLLPHL